MMERLTGRNKHNGYIATTSSRHGEGVYDAIVEKLFYYEDTGLTPAEAAELAQAKRDGRLVVLPCKVGDAIWKIKSAFSYFTKPMEDRVERIIIYKNEILVCCTSGTKFSIDCVGKIVFISREEAEKALKESENNERTITD